MGKFEIFFASKLSVFYSAPVVSLACTFANSIKLNLTRYLFMLAVRLSWCNVLFLKYSLAGTSTTAKGVYGQICHVQLKLA